MRIGSTSFVISKPVEPGRDEGAARVETIRNLSSGPGHKSPGMRGVVSTQTGPAGFENWIPGPSGVTYGGVSYGSVGS